MVDTELRIPVALAPVDSRQQEAKLQAVAAEQPLLLE
jgi:hypothetical protein